VAILIEGVQGEGGITPATPEYLLGLRQLCDEKRILLLIDEVQCGHFRTGRFQSFHRILENGPAASNFVPDGVSMAKSLGGGFPMGAFWVRQPYADLLGPGTHATTFGGTPLACAVGLKVLEVIERDKLAANARAQGETLKTGLTRLTEKFPTILNSVRGLGLMVGFELCPNIPAFARQDRTPSAQFVDRLHQAGLLVVPAGSQVLRLLPPLNLRSHEVEEGLGIIETVIQSLDAR
jgi:acetylornithine aminotransferase/acetylornithine/N-succinyldiaminopimelate aminotransferase